MYGHNCLVLVPPIFHLARGDQLCSVRNQNGCVSDLLSNCGVVKSNRVKFRFKSNRDLILPMTSYGEGLGNRGRTRPGVRGGISLPECRCPEQSPGSFEIFNILQRNIELKNI